MTSIRFCQMRGHVSTNFDMLDETLAEFNNCPSTFNMLNYSRQDIVIIDTTKDYKNGICCFSAKHAPLKRKDKDLLAQIQDNVSELGDMSIHGLLFQ